MDASGRLYVLNDKTFVPSNMNVKDKLVRAMQDVWNRNTFGKSDKALLEHAIQDQLLPGRRSKENKPAGFFGAGFAGLTTGTDRNAEKLGSNMVGEGSADHLKYLEKRVTLAALQQLSGLPQEKFYDLLAGKLPPHETSKLLSTFGGKAADVAPIELTKPSQDRAGHDRPTAPPPEKGNAIEKPIHDITDAWAAERHGPLEKGKYSPAFLDVINKTIEKNLNKWNPAELTAARELQRAYEAAVTSGKPLPEKFAPLHDVVNGWAARTEANKRYLQSSSTTSSDGGLQDKPLTEIEKGRMRALAKGKASSGDHHDRAIANELGRLLGEGTMDTIHSGQARVKQQSARDALFLYQSLGGTTDEHRPRITSDCTSWSPAMQSTPDGRSMPRVGSQNISQGAWEKLIPGAKLVESHAIPQDQAASRTESAGAATASGGSTETIDFAPPKGDRPSREQHAAHAKDSITTYTERKNTFALAKPGTTPVMAWVGQGEAPIAVTELPKPSLAERIKYPLTPEYQKLDGGIPGLKEDFYTRSGSVYQMSQDGTLRQVTNYFTVSNDVNHRIATALMEKHDSGVKVEPHKSVSAPAPTGSRHSTHPIEAPHSSLPQLTLTAEGVVITDAHGGIAHGTTESKTGGPKKVESPHKTPESMAKKPHEQTKQKPGGGAGKAGIIVQSIDTIVGPFLK
jgi:hypothetical protein